MALTLEYPSENLSSRNLTTNLKTLEWQCKRKQIKLWPKRETLSINTYSKHNKPPSAPSVALPSPEVRSQARR